MKFPKLKKDYSQRNTRYWCNAVAVSRSTESDCGTWSISETDKKTFKWLVYNNNTSERFYAYDIHSAKSFCKNYGTEKAQFQIGRTIQVGR